MKLLTIYEEIEPYITKDGSIIRELIHPAVHGNSNQSLAEATVQYVQQKHPEMAPRDRRKWARQAARSILPNATETKIFVTGNSRSWRHFLELRGSIHADTEIRLLAVEVFRVFKKESG